MFTGEVYTWGDNDEGQLGDGTTNAIQKPRLVAALQGLSWSLVPIFWSFAYLCYILRQLYCSCGKVCWNNFDSRIPFLNTLNDVLYSFKAATHCDFFV